MSVCGMYVTGDVSAVVENASETSIVTDLECAALRNKRRIRVEMYRSKSANNHLNISVQ